MTPEEIAALQAEVDKLKSDNAKLSKFEERTMRAFNALPPALKEQYRAVHLGQATGITLPSVPAPAVEPEGEALDPVLAKRVQGLEQMLAESRQETRKLIEGLAPKLQSLATKSAWSDVEKDLPYAAKHREAVRKEAEEQGLDPENLDARTLKLLVKSVAADERVKEAEARAQAEGDRRLQELGGILAPRPKSLGDEIPGLKDAESPTDQLLAVYEYERASGLRE